MSYKKNNILIALPISLKDSIDILNLIRNILESDKYLNDKNWILKPHPELKLTKLKREFEKTFEKLQIVHNPIKNLLSQTSLVITNGSSVAIEALVLGIPVCIIGAQNGFTQNPIPSAIDPRIYQICYTKKEFSNFLKKIFSYKESDFRQLIKIGIQIKSDYFEPINKKSVKSLLHLK